MCTEKDMNIADMVKMEFESSILAAYDEWKLDNEVPTTFSLVIESSINSP